MKIKKKLAIKFALIVASILLMSSLAVYFSSAQYRKQEFNTRLKNKAISMAKLLIEVNEVDENLLKIIDRTTISLPKEKVVIYNYLDEEIYNSREEPDDSIPKKLLNETRLEKEIYYTEGSKEVVGLLYTGNYDRFVVIASAEDIYGLSKLKNLAFVLILVFLTSIGITILAGWAFASQALKPISNVVNEVKNISASNLHARLDEGNGNDEIANLAITFNQMLGRLEAAFNLQKSFVSNASHELRTPLTSVTSQIEVALIKKRTLEDYEKVLQSVLEDIKNLSQLSNGLLELAQMNLENKKIKMEQVRVDEILFDSMEELMQVKSDYHISFEYDSLSEDEERLKIYGSGALLKSALMNLLDNACKFSSDKKALVSLGEENGVIKIKICDKGIGISPEEQAFIREPFYRANNAQEIKGHGLGLSLTQKILSLHEGYLEIESILNEGTTVTILFSADKKFL